MRYRGRDVLTAADVGRRVTVRHALPEGGTTDVVGELLAADDEAVEVRRRDGSTARIERPAITAARVHPQNL